MHLKCLKNVVRRELMPFNVAIIVVGLIALLAFITSKIAVKLIKCQDVRVQCKEKVFFISTIEGQASLWFALTNIAAWFVTPRITDQSTKKREICSDIDN